MKCPECNQKSTKVIESRFLEEKDSIKRRRECLKCKNRFTTYERIETPFLIVVKKDGTRELFNRNKLAKGIYKAVFKRPVPQEKIEALVSQIEKEIRSKEEEIDSREIGELVMEKLKNLDEVAYIRFASVYRPFRSIKAFDKEIKKVLSKK